jgi:hypothetical protein
MPRPHHPQPRRDLLWLVALLLLTGAAITRAQQPAAPTTRNVSGHVTDEGHEPLRGAIVKLQDPDTNSVITYITTADGEYHFKRLNGSADYRIWASYRGHSSPVHSISKFDNHMQTVVNFKIRAY